MNRLYIYEGKIIQKTESQLNVALLYLLHCKSVGRGKQNNRVEIQYS